MTAYTVVLAIALKGKSATIGSTCDVIDADTIDEAEQLAVELWQQARPDCTFRPLVTHQH